MIDEYDDLTLRCPRIGGYVNFKLCRSENNFLPCRWVVRCWEGWIDVRKFLEENFSAEDLDKALRPPKQKLESLVEVMEKAKKRNE